MRVPMDERTRFKEMQEGVIKGITKQQLTNSTRMLD